MLDGSAITAIAEQLRLPVATVAGSASFYADLAQAGRGRRHVQVCQGTSCFAATSGHHVRQVEDALGVQSGHCAPDGSVSLQGVHCLGYCYTSPAVLDDGVPVVGPGLAHRLSSVDGAHPAVPRVPFVSASSPAVILAGLTGQEASWQAWPQVLKVGSAARVLTETTAAGLRGRGGAEYPVGAKWRAAAGGPAPRYVVANGDEGDPGSFCDRLLMERDPHRYWRGWRWPGSPSARSAGTSWCARSIRPRSIG